MENKEMYQAPEMEVVMFAMDDVIATSGAGINPTPTPGGGIVLPDDEW